MGIVEYIVGFIPRVWDTYWVGRHTKEMLESQKQGFDLLEKGWRLKEEQLQLEISRLNASYAGAQASLVRSQADVADLKTKLEAANVMHDQASKELRSENEQLQSHVKDLEKQVHDLRAPKEVDVLELRILQALANGQSANAFALATELGSQDLAVAHRLERLARRGLLSWTQDKGKPAVFTIKFEGRELLASRNI